MVVMLLFWNQHDARTGFELTRRFQIANANARSLQVAENGDGTTERSGDFAHRGNRFRMLFVRAMREVDACHIESGFDETTNPFGGVARGPQRADDLRARHMAAMEGGGVRIALWRGGRSAFGTGARDRHVEFVRFSD